MTTPPGWAGSVPRRSCAGAWAGRGLLVFPALWTVYLGLTNFRLTGIAAATPVVVGLDNYANALGDPDLPQRALADPALRCWARR